MSLLSSNTTPAERRRGCSFSDDFQSAARVSKNGGAVTGAPTFDDEGGVTLDGAADYLTYNLLGTEFNDDPLSIVIEFTPDFDYDENSIREFFSGDATGRCRLYKNNNASNNTLVLLLGGTAIATIASATYSPSFAAGERHVLVISGTSADTDAWLINSDATTQILTADATAWTPGAMTSLYVGASHLGVNHFDGTIHSVQVYKARLTEKEAQDFYDETVYSYPDDATAILDLTAASHDPTGVKALDVSGNGNDAVLGDGSTPATYPTKLSNHRGYTFDGANDYFSSMPTLPANYTVTYAKKVANVLTIAHENVNTTYNQIGTTGGFTGDLLYLSLVPYVLSDLQELDLQGRILKQVNDV